MATAAQAIESVAEITGLLPATVFRAARFMREADPTLWPMGEKGRGRAALVSNTHLVNLALVLAFDEAATASPNTAFVLRSMRPWLDSSWMWQATSTDGQIRPQPSPGDQAHPGDSAASRLTNPPGDKSAYIYEWTKSLIVAGKLQKRLEYAALPGETLGEALENLVDYLTLPEGGPLKAEIKATSMEVDITSAGLPSAFVGYWSFDGDREFYVRTNYLLPQESLNLFKQRVSLGITRSARIHGDLILCLAELWAETKTRLPDPRGSSGGTTASRASPEVTPKASSETKTAATGPGRLEAAVRVDQSRTELGGLTHPTLRAREKNLNRSPAGLADPFITIGKTRMPDPEMVALTALSRELAALTGASVVPTYRQLWNMVVDGRLTSVKQVGRAYRISRADLPALAEQLGLVGKAQKPQRAGRKAIAA